MIFITLAKLRIRLPEDDADASKHVGVLMIHKILLIHIYICCAFVGLDIKLTAMFTVTNALIHTANYNK